MRNSVIRLPITRHLLTARNIVLLLSLLLSPVSQANQTVTLTESELEQLIEARVQEIIQDGQYTRIPNKDFDQLITSKINTEVDSQLNGAFAVLAAVIAVLGGALISYLRLSFTALINKQVKSAQDEISNTIEERISLREKESIAKITRDIEDLRSYEHIYYETHLTRLREEFKTAVNKDKVAEKLEALLDRVMARKLDESTDVTKDIISELSYVFYEIRDYQKLSDLIDKYESYLKTDYITYFNASLPHANNYTRLRNPESRAKAVEYLGKSLNILNNYGNALATMLEVYMVDHKFAVNENDQKIAYNAAANTLKSVLSSPVGIYETYERLISDRQYPSVTEYVDLLFELFPDTMNELAVKHSLYKEYQNASQINDKAKADELLEKINQPIDNTQADS